MSNLIKSGFVAFSQNDKLIIDANKSKIIKSIDEVQNKGEMLKNVSMEEALADSRCAVGRF